MAQHTKPAFIVGSGRSGTKAIAKLFSGVADVEIHHEYCCTHIHRTTSGYYMGLVDRPSTLQKIRELHGAAVYYSPASTWIDSSNKLSWIIEPLYEVFPNAKFVHITRDGRRVTGSFYYKLWDAYNDASVAIMLAWLADRSLPAPPPEKKYWQNIPQPGQPFYEEFREFGRFQRICYHWRETVRVISESFCRIPLDRQMTVKLEDLTANEETLKEFTEFLGIPYQKSFYQALQRPENFVSTVDFKLTPEQLEQFKAITGDTMERLGYDINSEMYEVKY